MIGAHFDPVTLGVYRVSSSKDLLLTGLATFPSKSFKQAVCVSKVGVRAHMQRRNLLDCHHLQAVQTNIAQSICCQELERGGEGGVGENAKETFSVYTQVSIPRALGASTKGRRQGRVRE